MTASALPPRLSVLLVTYNHAEYVRKAVDSILMQDIDEPFEIIVADDGSTDDTVAILESIAERNPDIPFRFLDFSTNRGITRNYQRAFSACVGEYVAVMEGDDYWVSPSKLGAQRTFLDSHRECDLCSVNYYVFEEPRGQFTPRTTPGAGFLIFGARELIADNLVGNFSTCMYRMEALQRLPTALYDVQSYDWVINICIARYGLIGFLNEPMSVYRIHDIGAWSLLSHVDKLKQQLEMLPAYDALTDRVFHREFALLSGRLDNAIAEATAHPVSAESQLLTVQLMSLPPLRSKLLDLVPPILIAIGRQVLPPAFRRYLARLLFKS